jgi:7-carboxy-7-deazaguanine synthase
MYDENPHIREMMLTGGSPTMQPDLVNELTHFAYSRGIFITIETEGSHFVETDYPIGLISLSPKFNNSIPKLGVLTPIGREVDQKFIDQHNKFRLNREVMQQMMEYHGDYHYKPVWDGTQEGLNEIESFRAEMDIPKWKTWLMPAGDTRETLIDMYPKSIELCMKMGYNWTGRDHIIAYDTKRAV